MAKKQAPKEEQVAEERELVFDKTNDFEIIVERYLSQRSVSGTDSGYGIRNKRTGVVEMRWGAYSEALQGLTLLQEALDKQQGAFEATHKRLN